MRRAAPSRRSARRDAKAARRRWTRQIRRGLDRAPPASALRRRRARPPERARRAPARPPARRAPPQVFASNVHEEAQEEDILDKFGEFGEVKNIHVNLDRRTGFVKGYALIEYAVLAEAEAAIAEMDGADLLGQTLAVDWAFRKEDGKRQRRR